MSAEMYNACLESRKGGYAWWTRGHNSDTETVPPELNPSLYDLDRMFTEVRAVRPDWAAVSVKVGRGVIRRFYRTRNAFYDRCRNGKPPGYPRFKSAARWRTLEIPNASPSMIVPPGERGNGSAKWWRLQVKGLPRIRFEDRGGRIQAALDSGARMVELRVVRTALRVEVHVVLRVIPTESPKREPTRPVGIDKGLTRRLTLSDGTDVPSRQPDRSDIGRKQRALSRAEKGSRTRAKKRSALAKACRRESERARDADFRLADHLVTTYDGVAVEDLNVAAMLRSRLFSHKMSAQRWAAFDAVLEHKAGKAGIQYVKVNPANTSTDCSLCGHRQPMPLGTPDFICGNCREKTNRDVNAARNICARAGWSWDREGASPV